MAERYDFDAVAADDALLDLLAAGGDGAFELRDNDDPAIQLLAELRLAVEEIDEQPAAVLIDAEAFLSRVAARTSTPSDPLARKIATRSLALSVAAVAALSVSGVAAAVGGDPLAPYEKVIERVVDAVSPQTSFPVDKINGLVIGNKNKMVQAEKEWVTGQHKSGELVTGLADLTDPATSEYAQSLGITPQRTVARPKPPFVLPPEKPTDVKPSTTDEAPVDNGKPANDNGKPDNDNGKPDNDNGKPSEQGPTPPVAPEPTTGPTENPTPTVTQPPTTDPTPTENPTTPAPTDDPTPTPSDGGNGQGGQNQGQGQQNQPTDESGSTQPSSGTADDGDKGGTDDKGQGTTGELDGTVSSTPSAQQSDEPSQPSSDPGAASTLEPTAELTATPASTPASTPAATSEQPAETPASTQVDPAAVMRQSLTNAIKARAASTHQHHHARASEARKAAAHARHARREHADNRQRPDIADNRLLAAVTNGVLGTAVVLGG